jgi:lipoprotein-anchoring transpeptidase ErfK/SrfK
MTRTRLRICLVASALLACAGTALAVEAPRAATTPGVDAGAPKVAALQPVTSAKPADTIDGRPVVAMPEALPAGTILVLNSERRLYLSLGDGRAIVYPVAIGKPGRAFHGTVRITRKVANPGWTPTPNIRAENPGLPAYVPPGPKNPLGPRALYLSKGYYRIHGTNKPSSIGRAASNGCIRMFNKDILDLYARVSAGAAVIVR